MPNDKNDDQKNALIPGADGKGTTPATEAPVTPAKDDGKDSGTVSLKQHVDLQKAHETQGLENAALKEQLKGVDFSPLMDAMSLIKDGVDKQNAEAVSSKLETYKENGNEEAALRLARREIGDQIKRFNLTMDSPQLAGVKAKLDGGDPFAAFDHFTTVKTVLVNQSPITPAPGSNGDNDTTIPPADTGEKIGGKTKVEIEADSEKVFRDKYKIFDPVTTPPSGGGGELSESFDPKKLIDAGFQEHFSNSD